ncbi:hypothetical protein NJH78_30040 [Pseudomonas chlororaphis]|uniref:hypothetical protein n=1 Tax=Pseudomonas chlororaphis TaxID=587753 RepID=UPI00209BB16B|nr:hypothetical protein [Pseudomonas chlororaphis]MCO7574237.1 hypothetical protein [Pseudomonas chlororaphis]MCO7591755.1 hypothetical protein [Pseudomonas chlororaphis]
MDQISSKCIPKKIASPISTGDRGGAFERRVQASRLLAMCLGLSCAGVPKGFEIVSLQFQGRLFGHNTDDLIIYSLCPDTGRTATVRMQMKRTLTPNSEEFKEAVGLAWLDFIDPFFNKELDEIQIVFDSSSLSSMRGVAEVISFARSSLTQAAWLQKINTEKFSNERNRKAYFAMEFAVKSYDSESFSDEMFHSFVKSLRILGETSDSDKAAGIECQKQLIFQQLPLLDTDAVWARLVTVCTELNGVAGEIALSNLDLYMSELVTDFGVARLLRKALGVSAEKEILKIKQDPYYKELSSRLSSLKPTAMCGELPASLMTEKQEFAGEILSQAIRKTNEDQGRVEHDGISPILRATPKSAPKLKQLTNYSVGQILESWFDDYEYIPESEQHFVITELQCELFAANLETGELSEERVETTARAYIVASIGKNPLLEREYRLLVSGHGHDELELLWQFAFNLPKQKGYFVRMKKFTSSHYVGDYLRKNLIAYEKVLAKILGGWKPVVRLGLLGKNGDRYHGDVAPISNIPQDDQLLEMHRRIKVINLVLNLAEKHKIPLRLSDAAFDKLLTEELMATAVHELATACTPYPPADYRSAAYVQDENWEICMVVKPFFIGFKKLTSTHHA